MVCDPMTGQSPSQPDKTYTTIEMVVNSFGRGRGGRGLSGGEPPRWLLGKGVRLERGRPGFESVSVVDCFPKLSPVDRLVGLVVKASTSRAEDPEFESRLRRDFFGVESYQ